MARNEKDPLMLKLMHDTMVQSILQRTGISDHVESFVKESCSNAEERQKPADDGKQTDEIERSDEKQQKQHSLHQALQNGDFDFAEKLIDQGYHDLCVLDLEFKSPLHHALYASASYKYDHQSIKLSLWESLVSNSIINQQDSSGKYPIDIAAGMKTKPLPLPVLCKLMSPQNMNCFTLVKLAVIVPANDFLKMVDFALPLFRPNNLKFNGWRVFVFDKLDEVYSNHCTHVTCSNRLLLKRCIDSERNIDKEKIRQLVTLLWNAGYSDVATFTENSTTKFVEKSSGNILVGMGSENDAPQKALVNLLCNPRSLMDLCRITVRNHIQELSEASFVMLQLPPCLASYLSFNRTV